MNKADIQHLFAYTEWANKLILDAAEGLTDEQLRHDFQTSHGSIFGTLQHNAGAEWIWLERWKGVSPTLADWEARNEAQGNDLGNLRRSWEQTAEERRAFLHDLDEAQLAADFSYKQADGTPATLPLAGLMQHAVNHATLHRGQVMGMMRQLGVKPPATDLLFYLREKAAEARA
jgi:uncharacterized damage-inducible protein DinB